MNAPAPDRPALQHTPLFPLGKDTTPYRKLTGRRACGSKRSSGATCWWSSARRSARWRKPPSPTSTICCGRAHLKQLRDILDDPEASAQRQVRRLRLPEERQHRGRRRAADVPGHRHRHHHGQEGPARSSPTATTRRRSPRARATPTSSATCAIRSSRRSRCSRRRTPSRTCRRRSRSTPRTTTTTNTSSCSWPRAAARPTSRSSFRRRRRSSPTTA